ncbi:MAG: hypothetical protein EPO40_19715 [Myxococcaceae bacterium]|nr:MAG: hypothetical protein EPO40_19715 [Myxococcaceae bacterium]
MTRADVAYPLLAQASLLMECQAWLYYLAGDARTAEAIEARADDLWARAEAARASRTRGDA